LLWQKAVNNLRRVPEDSPVAAFAQQKLAEYEANYETIGQRLTTEERAAGHLNEAMAAGEEATALTENAATLTDWLRAEQAWDRAVNALSRIPKGTLAYEEARSLLSDYRREHVQTRTRVTFENAGERSYQDALASAAEARTAAQNNQWTLAVDHWSKAFAQMRQVPKNTIRYEEAQTQLQAYEESLEQAQNRLKQAVALETIEDDLAELCPLDEGICTYSYTGKQIELTLRDPYDSAIRQSISPPSTQGHFMQANSVVEETHELVQNIMFLGNRVQLPISIYDVNRRFIARYQPEYGGFVKQP
jgi:tetratricopeptide (TPR) repeat protein